MQNDVLNAFFDEAETALTAVRGGLLVFARGGRDPGSLESPLAVIRSLRSTAAMFDLAELQIALDALDSRMRNAVDAGQAISEMEATQLLDALVAAERIVGDLHINNAGVGLNISDFVDQSFSALLAADAPDDAEESPDEDTFDASDIDPELREVFASEAEFLLKNIETQLEILSGDPSNKEALWEIKRNAHTFKGASGIVGLKLPSKLAHKMEDVLERVGAGSTNSQSRLVAVVAEATATLRALTIGEMDPAAEKAAAKLISAFETEVLVAPEPPAQDGPPPGAPNRPLDDEPAPRHERRSFVRVPLETLDSVVANTRKLLQDESRTANRVIALERQLDELRASTDRLQDACQRIWAIASAVGAAPIGDPIKTRMQIYEASVKVMETAADATTIFGAMDAIRDELLQTNRQHKVLLAEAESRLISARLVAFSSLQNRLRRAISLTCEEELKKADLVIENGDVLVDTQIADLLVEPLIHLMKNAVVHGIERPEMRRLLGKPEVGEIRVRAEVDREFLELTVSDDGQGIDPEALRHKALKEGLVNQDEVAEIRREKLVELIFLRGLTTAEKLTLSAGRGVGMGIVKESIESAGGEVAISSVVRKGTTFMIRLPLPFTKTDTETMETALSGKVSEERGRRLLLLVDDSPSVRHTTLRIVEEAGYAVSIASDGAEALEKLRSLAELPDLVLSDLEMPQMDGFEMARQIRSHERLKNIPIVFMTSRSAESEMATANELGARDYLVKPCEPQRILSAINAIVGRA